MSIIELLWSAAQQLLPAAATENGNAKILMILAEGRCCVQ